MKIGIVGLGRMGSGIAGRLARGGHQVVGFDTDPVARERLGAIGVPAAPKLADLVERLEEPRHVWLMLPAGTIVDRTLDELAGNAGPEALIVDGGNSNYRDSIRRHDAMSARNIAFLDVGTSGGVRGAQDGYCLMVGGHQAAVDRLRPVLETLAPSPDRGWARVGPPGAGHFVKMIHNGIEYGLMQAYAEGFAILEARRDLDLDLEEIAELWQSGSVVRSWLLELVGRALADDPRLERVTSRVEDSGEGRWTVAEALDLDVAAPVITLSLLSRFHSRTTDAFSHRMLSALRREFGGHDATGGE